jgi:glutamine amidotransferase
MIALIDYGAGNLTSVRKAFAALGADIVVPSAPSDIVDASSVVVPGVGHFGATAALGDDWTEAILARVGEGRPLLGICLGMQWLFEGSEEAPECRGLGLLAGRCYRLGKRGRESFSESATRYAETENDSRPLFKIPHVGWNALELRREAALVEGVTSGAQVYFTHSFAAPVTGDVVAVTEHGEPFAAIVQRGHVTGVQFHPEKSGEVGLQILRNFLQLAG